MCIAFKLIFELFVIVVVPHFHCCFCMGFTSFLLLFLMLRQAAGHLANPLESNSWHWLRYQFHDNFTALIFSH